MRRWENQINWSCSDTGVGVRLLMTDRVTECCDVTATDTYYAAGVIGGAGEEGRWLCWMAELPQNYVACDDKESLWARRDWEPTPHCRWILVCFGTRMYSCVAVFLCHLRVGQLVGISLYLRFGAKVATRSARMPLLIVSLEEGECGSENGCYRCLCGSGPKYGSLAEPVLNHPSIFWRGGGPLT